MSYVQQYLTVGNFCLCSGEEGVLLMTDWARSGMTDDLILGGVTIPIPVELATVLGEALIQAARTRSN